MVVKQFFSMLLLATAVIVSHCAAQQITLSGYVSEQRTGERLTGVVVYLPALNAGTTTNTYGFFSLTVASSADSLELKASYAGYHTYTTKLPVNASKELNIAMEDVKDLKEVVITGNKNTLQHSTRMSTIDLPIETIKKLPAFMGEPDIMKAIQLLPGIQGGNEGTSGLYVRGGSPDQNLILLDGVPVYNASHLFGFFSVFNADAIRNVEVIKGGFPSRYGGRLSSVIDINMKEGDKNKFHGEGGIGLIASRLTLEGPISKGKSSFMISGRRTYIDVLAKPFLNKNDLGGYFFYDLNAKANFELTRKDHVYASGYFGNDKFYYKTKSSSSTNSSKDEGSIKWGNITAVTRWNHEFNPKVFGNLTAYYSQYRFLVQAISATRNPNFQENFELKYQSGIYDYCAKYDLDIIPSVNHYIKVGAGIINHAYAPGAQTVKLNNTNQNFDTTVGPPRLHANEIDVYAEDDYRITSKLKANIGVHWAAFSIRDKLYNSFQPRVSARYLLSDAVSLKASFVQMNQYLNLLTNSSVGLPTDLWVPATDKIAPQQALQYAAGAAWTHPKGIEFSLEGYYKQMDNLIEYKEGSSFFNSSTSWEDKIVSGKGTSYGGEVFVQKKKGRFNGMLAYTLSWTNRTFPALNGGKTYPYKYDRRHDFKVAAVYSLSEKVELSAEWVYGTGNAITLPIGSYHDQDGSQIRIYGSRNGYRMAAYHRADIGLRFTKKFKRWERTWVIGAYNVYNRMNPFFVYEDQGTFKQISLFPILPSVTYNFKF